MMEETDLFFSADGLAWEGPNGERLSTFGV